MKAYVDYEKARQAAVGGSFNLDESEYAGFRDIGEGGVLDVISAADGLHLAGDTESGILISAEDIPTRPAPCDASCLKRDADGGVRLRVGGKIGGKD